MTKCLTEKELSILLLPKGSRQVRLWIGDELHRVTGVGTAAGYSGTFILHEAEPPSKQPKKKD